MTSVFSRATVSSVATTIAGVATTGLRNLGATTCRVGPEIVPTAAAPELIAIYRLSARYVGIPSASTIVAQCWFAVDVGNAGTYPNVATLADGSSSIRPNWAPDFQFVWDVTTTGPSVVQSIPKEVARPPWKHKVIFYNAATTATANNNDTETILLESTVNDLGT